MSSFSVFLSLAEGPRAGKVLFESDGNTNINKLSPSSRAAGGADNMVPAGIGMRRKGYPTHPRVRGTPSRRGK